MIGARLKGWAAAGPDGSALRHDERGAVAIEFAVVAPVFFFLLFVIAETAMVFIAEQVMDNAVTETARLVRTGQVHAVNMSDEQFHDAMCARASVFVNCDSPDFYLDVRSYSDFAAMDVSPPLNEDESFKAAGEYEFGGQNDIVVVRAYYQWPTNRIFGGLSLNNLENGRRLIGSFAAFRNEPFTQSAQN